MKERGEGEEERGREWEGECSSDNKNEAIKI